MRLIFVYLGRSLPEYVRSSLELASCNSGMRLLLLASDVLVPKIRMRDVDVIPVSDFYDPTAFGEAAKRLTYSSRFREGFWLRTLERFFVLGQYLDASSDSAFIHAELDQLLFRVDELEEALSRVRESGIFMPFHSRDAAVGSLVYCNSRESLRSLLAFASTCAPYPNEMALLARWASEQRNQFFALPTLSSEIRRFQDSHDVLNLPVPLIDVSALGGITDAAQLGQWVAGIDPRNVPTLKWPRTRFVDSPQSALLTREELMQVKFKFQEDTRQLACQLNDYPPLSVFNLHLHSKIHGWLAARDGSFRKLISWCNGPEAVRLPASRIPQLKYRLGTRPRERVSERFRGQNSGDR